MIAVDTISKHVVIHQYIKGEEDLEGEADDMVRRKSRLLHPFVPSEFPKFFWPHQVFASHVLFSLSFRTEHYVVPVTPSVRKSLSQVVP